MKFAVVQRYGDGQIFVLHEWESGQLAKEAIAAFVARRTLFPDVQEEPRKWWQFGTAKQEPVEFDEIAQLEEAVQDAVNAFLLELARQ